MRISRDYIIVMALLLALIVGAIALGTRQQTAATRLVGNDDYPLPTVSNDRAAGSKALFMWLQSRGYSASAWKKPWSDLPNDSNATLIMISPQALNSDSSLSGGAQNQAIDPHYLSAHDAVRLEQWISPGRTALLLSSDLSDGSGQPDPFARDLGLVVKPLDDTIAAKYFAPLQPAGLTSGTIAIESDSGSRVQSLSQSGLPLYGDKNGAAAELFPIGKGRLIVIADDSFANNTNLASADNAVFLANIFSRYALPGSAALFDEYHLGLGDDDQEDSSWQLLGRPLQAAILQLCLAGLVLALYLGRRFGPPVPLVVDQRRSSAEYVVSLASLYRRAGASLAALQILHHSFRLDLADRLGLPAESPSAEIATAAARRMQSDRGRLADLLEDCRRRIESGHLSEAELADLARRMENMRKEMGLV